MKNDMDDDDVLKDRVDFEQQGTMGRRNHDHNFALLTVMVKDVTEFSQTPGGNHNIVNRTSIIYSVCPCGVRLNVNTGIIEVL